MLKLPDGTVKVLVEGVSRVSLKDVKDDNEFISSDFSIFLKKCQSQMRAKL